MMKRVEREKRRKKTCESKKNVTGSLSEESEQSPIERKPHLVSGSGKE